MANLTFTDLQSEVFDHTGLDSTDTGNQTRVKRWLNYTQQNVCSKYPWSFMVGRESIVTVKDYTTGTVSINSGASTVTGAGTTFTTAMGAGQYSIQFTSGNDWYRIASFSSSTSITLEQPYQGTTNLSGSTYIIRKFWYSLSASCDRILDIVNWDTPVKLVQVDPRYVDNLNPLVQSTNSSYAYFPFGVDSSGNIQISPYPYPSDARLLEIRTRKKPTDMSAGTDAPSIPNKYAYIIAWGANSIGFAYLRKFEEAAAWNTKFMAEIDSMRKFMSLSTDDQPVLRSIDGTSRTKWIQMPDQYPIVQGTQG